MGRCEARTEVYARICGFYRPVQEWNPGKRAEYENRKTYDPEKAGLKQGEKTNEDQNH